MKPGLDSEAARFQIQQKDAAEEEHQKSMNLEPQPIDQPVFTPPFQHGRAVLSFAWPLRGANGAMASPKEETSWGDAKGLALEAMPSCKEYQFVQFAGKITSQGSPPWFFLWGFIH